MVLGMHVGLGPRDFVTHGDPSLSSPNRGQSPPFFSPCLLCQTPAWINMALGMEVGLGVGHIVIHGDPVPFPPKGAEPPPIFGPFVLWPNGWMDEDAAC